MAMNSIAQDNFSVQRADSAVSAIEKDIRQTQRFRWLMGFVEYAEINNRIRFIVYSYKAGPKQVIETFYVADSGLLFVTKQADAYFFYGDTLALLGKYYFDRNVLKQYDVYRDEERKDLSATQESILSEYEKVKSVIIRRKKKSAGR